MKTSFTLITSLAGLISFAVAEIGVYGQCGGASYKGEIACVSDAVCTGINEDYSQCLSVHTTRDSDPMVGYAALGKTTGGAGGSTIRVSTLAALKSAVSGNSPKTVILTASLTGHEIVLLGPNTTLLGANGGVTLHGIGVRVYEVSNVIIRNLKIVKVLADIGDAIGVQSAANVWIDHVDLSSDLDHDPDYYDGLIDITLGCTGVTVSWSYMHDHWLASLIGHSDDNGAQDKAITVTYHHNYFARIYTRTPCLRFGTGHIYNNYFTGVHLGIDARDGSQLLVENNVFFNTTEPLFSSTKDGSAVSRGNAFGGVNSDMYTVSGGSFTSPPYAYSLTSTGSVESVVVSGAGAKLSF